MQPLFYDIPVDDITLQYGIMCKDHELNDILKEIRAVDSNYFLKTTRLTHKTWFKKATLTYQYQILYHFGQKDFSGKRAYCFFEHFDESKGLKTIWFSRNEAKRILLSIKFAMLNNTYKKLHKNQ